MATSREDNVGQTHPKMTLRLAVSARAISVLLVLLFGTGGIHGPPR